MEPDQDRAARVDRLRTSYEAIGGPTAEQWNQLSLIPHDRPISLVNLFAFRDEADYGDDRPASPVTGREAFDRYAAVSAPALDRVGGQFVHVGSHLGNLVGTEERWDLMVMGSYPSLDALLALHEDETYRDAYRHRVAACAEQRVLITT